VAGSVRARRAAAVVGAALLVSACGIDVQDSPETIDRDDVPFGFYEPTTTSSSIPTGAGDDPVPFVVYFVAPDGLAFAIREAAEDPTASERLDALFDGPTATEVGVGLHTAIPPAATRLTVRVRDGTALIDLQEPFAALRGTEQVEALAQIVFTVTEVDAVRRVQFLLDGAPVEVPRADGTVSSGPVTRTDYRLRSSEPTTPSTSTTTAPLAASTPPG